MSNPETHTSRVLEAGVGQVLPGGVTKAIGFIAIVPPVPNPELTASNARIIAKSEGVAWGELSINLHVNSGNGDDNSTDTGAVNLPTGEVGHVFAITGTVGNKETILDDLERYGQALANQAQNTLPLFEVAVPSGFVSVMPRR